MDITLHYRRLVLQSEMKVDIEKEFLKYSGIRMYQEVSESVNGATDLLKL